MTTRYLRSKTLLPRLQRGLVVRSRLLDRLQASTEPVWLLSAPAGSGKTTLLLQALGDRSDHDHRRTTVPADTVAWMSVDAADDDPVRFWVHVCAAVLDDAVFEEVVDGLEPDRPQATVDRLLAEVERRAGRTVLVLDDLHELRNPDTLESLGRVLLRPPANLRVVLVTRSDLDLPVSRLRARGDVLVIDGDDLAFTADETSELFDDGIDGATVATLLARTAGWATALQMMAVSAGPGRTTSDLLAHVEGDHSAIAAFLAGEVLAAQPPVIRDFLVVTSLTEQLEPDLCNVVAERSDSLGVLRELARNHLFTQLVDPDGPVYRYHPVFRAFLRSRAAELPTERVVRARRAAAEWCDACGDPVEAVRHAMAVGDDEFALATIKRHYSSCAQRGLIATVTDWLELYGFDRCRRDPDLRMMAAWSALNARRYDLLDQWLAPPDPGVDPPELAWQVAAIRSHRARHLGQLDLALEQAELAARLAANFGEFQRGESEACRGYVGVLAGERDRERHLRTVAHGLAAGVPHTVVSGYMTLALVDSADLDDGAALVEADRLADLALTYVEGPVTERFHQPAMAWIAKARVARAHGRFGDAQRAAERADHIAVGGQEPLVRVVAACERAIAAHHLGDRSTVALALKEAEASLGERSGGYLAGLVRDARNVTRFAVTADGRPGLSEREWAVLRTLPFGLSRRQIAEQLFVSQNTIKTQLTSIRHKLGVPPRGDIVVRARELGLLDDG